jgi:hypothetical protein
MKKQTAVEWLVEQISYTTTRSEIISYHKDISKLVEKAKEMEEEQFINLHIEAMKEGLIVEGSQQWEEKYLPKIKLIAKKIYNKTFKK